MRRKLLLLTPALLGMLLAGCTTTNTSEGGGGGEGSTPAPTSETSGEQQSETSESSSESSSSSSSSSSEEPATQQATLSFNSRGGSSVASVTVDKGTSINAPTKPTRSGYSFVGWSYNTAGTNLVSWPLTLNSDTTIYANWNESINIKDFLQSLIGARNQSPYSYIPETMRETNTANHVTRSAVQYDFSTSTSVSNIVYGGFGEQWHMVIENINESQRFYSVLTGAESLINASVVLFNNYLDNNPGDTADHTLNETTYTAKLTYDSGLLSYSLRYKTGFDVPFFGEVTPQIDMDYHVMTGAKDVRIQLTNTNALKYRVANNYYAFGIEYGVTTVSRKAYFEITKDSNNKVEGHIYEFVQYKDKDLVPSCADFYIDENYVSVVGNKASGIIGFSDYINELYRTTTGKLLGYEIREEKTILGVNVRFNTLWFNLNNITGITAIQYIDSDHSGGNDDLVGAYVNGSASKFVTKNVGGVSKKTASRRYDIELRKQYVYGIESEALFEEETEVPMMFIQEEVYDDFSEDVSSKNGGLEVSINLSSTYLDKIKSDYATLINVFIDNKGSVTSSTVETFIGDAKVIA